MGQKVNPRGFRIGVNNLWSNENQCYGKSFKNSKRLANELYQISNFLDYHFEKTSLIKGQTETKISYNIWKYDVPYVFSFPQINPPIDNLSIKIAKRFGINTEIKKFNTIFWYQSGALVCEFIKTALLKGLPFRKITNIIQALLKKKQKHQIVLKTLAGTKTFEFTGLKIRYAGRFGGSRSRMANNVVYRLGAVSLQKLETHIEFFETPLYTKQGICNLQVWMSYKIVQYEKI